MLKEAKFNSLSQFELDYTLGMQFFCAIACLKAHIETVMPECTYECYH